MQRGERSRRDRGSRFSVSRRPDEIARPRRLQRDARGDALDVRALPRACRAARREGRCRQSPIRLRHGIVARREHGAVAQRMVQRVAQEAAAHAGRAGVEQREQRRRRLAAYRLGELEVAPRRRVHAHVGALVLDGERFDVRDRRALRRARVFEQRAGGGDGDAASSRRAEPGEIVRLELPARARRAASRSNCHGGRRFTAAADPFSKSAVASSAIRISAGAQALELRARDWRRAVSITAKRPDASDSQARPSVSRSRCSASSRLSRLSSSSAASVSVPGVTTRVTLRSTGPLAVAGIADLLADRDRLAELHQPREVLLDRVVRHAGHLDRLAGRLAAARQRDVEQPRRALGVAVEHLVEIAHAVEEQHVGVLRLDAQILLHHRRVTTGRRSRGFRLHALDYKGGITGRCWSSAFP